MIELRPLAGDLQGPLEDFFQRVPESDHNSFVEDVFAPGAVADWLRDPHGRRAVAMDGELVVGYVAVLPLLGWSAHVGSIRVVVAPASRGQGVGRELARAGLLAGLELGLAKIVVEVVADAVPAIGLFEALGFEPEALLRDHIRDRTGTLRDLIVLSYLAEGNRFGLAGAGIDEARRSASE